MTRFFQIVATFCLLSSSIAAAPLKPGQISDKEAERLAIYRPRPQYPLSARQSKITGSGVVLVKVNEAGIVTSATMAQSTGSPILDNAATSGFRVWRFKAGKAFWFRSPITFTMNPFPY